MTRLSRDNETVYLDLNEKDASLAIDKHLAHMSGAIRYKDRISVLSLDIQLCRDIAFSYAALIAPTYAELADSILSAIENKEK